MKVFYRIVVCMKACCIVVCMKVLHCCVYESVLLSFVVYRTVTPSPLLLGTVPIVRCVVVRNLCHDVYESVEPAKPFHSTTLNNVRTFLFG
jgi:hypothetical protein